MAPIVAKLLFSGLTLLGNAVMAKGREAVEERLGVKLPAADEPLDAAKVAELRQIEQAHERWLIDAALRRLEIEQDGEGAAQAAVSERWRADMGSDSWLSKNIRPLILAWLTVAVSLMAFGSHWLKVDAAWIELLKAAYLLVLGAYFVARTYEKTRP